jgi:hypothetical protein
MGIPVFNFDDFEAKFTRVRVKKNLFGFFLYDSRPTHEVIDRFTQKRHNWLDELAGFGNIYFFFPLRKAKEKGFENPSLEVAKLFDIEASKLPGIILFNILPESDAHNSKAVYFELDEAMFAGELHRIEKIFIELFQILNKCQRKNKQPDELLNAVREEVERLQRSEKVQPFVRYLKKGATVIFTDLPQKILTAMAEGFGKAIGEHAAKG